MAPGKSLDVSGWFVWEVWGRVEADRGAPGVGGMSVEVFVRDLRGDLYGVWGRVVSGSDFPTLLEVVREPMTLLFTLCE